MKRFLDRLVGVPLISLLSLFKGKIPSIPSHPKKILIIKFAAMGDTILLKRVLKNVRKALPNATLHWLVSPINFALAKTEPSVDKIILASGGMLGFMRLLLELRSEKYEAVIDLEQWARGTALLSFLAGVPIRIGFDTPGQSRAGLFTHTVPKTTDNHEIYEFYNAVSVLTKTPRDEDLELEITDGGKAELNRYLEHVNLISVPLKVLIHPGCGADGLPREWPLADYALLGNWLLQKYKAKIFISSGPEEVKKADGLMRLLNDKAVNLGGKLSWEGVVALASQMDLVISGNTGIMHVAAALKKKQVALHGPTNPLLWGPLNPNARVLKTTCPSCPSLVLGFEYHTRDQSCMKQIPLANVKTAVQSLIDNS